MYGIKKINTSKEEAIKLISTRFEKLKSPSFDLDVWKERTELDFLQVFGENDVLIDALNSIQVDYPAQVGRLRKQAYPIFRKSAAKFLIDLLAFIRNHIDENRNSNVIDYEIEYKKLLHQYNKVCEEYNNVTHKLAKENSILEIANSEMKTQISYYIENIKSHKEAMQDFEGRLSEAQILQSKLSEDKENLQRKITDLKSRVEANERGDIPVGSVSFLRLMRSLTTPALWGVIGALAAIIFASGWLGINFQKFSSEKEIYELRKECQERIDQVKKDNYRPDVLRPN